MKKKKASIKQKSSGSREKTLYRQAGELIGTIGAHIALGTTRVVDFVSDEATIAKKAIKKKFAKKSAPKKKAIKKVASKAAKKSASKTTPRKPAAKKKKPLHRPRKTAAAHAVKS